MNIQHAQMSKTGVYDKIKAIGVLGYGYNVLNLFSWVSEQSYTVIATSEQKYGFYSLEHNIEEMTKYERRSVPR